MRVFVEGVGLAGPGFSGWRGSRAVLIGNQPYQRGPTVIAQSELLPPAERRRAGVPVKLALAVGGEALAAAGRDAASISTIFSSSSGDCENVHCMLEALASPARDVSPTRFHNSVHNAAAGYWSIATKCHAPSTSLACRDGSFAAGLLEASCRAVSEGEAVALIAYDHPYPEPLHVVRPIGAPFAIALVLAPRRVKGCIASLDIEYVPEEQAATFVENPELESLRQAVPAARGLPLLVAMARGLGATIVLEYVTHSHIRVTVTPCD